MISTPKRLSLVAGLLLLAGAAGARAATLQVRITHVKNGSGNVLVAVCRRAHFLSPNCAYHQSTPVRAGAVAVTFKHIPPGVYAVQAFHDANANYKLDRNWLGWPDEGMGFSNNAPMHHGPPAFSDAAIRLTQSGGQISFRMRYY
jgi:uncharacterized protein (DUF2141 family)